MTEPPSASSIIERAKRWMKLLKRRSHSPSINTDERAVAEFFSNATDFAINGSNFINELKVQYINDVISNRQAVFELLEPYTCLDATKDSSARYPPPKCHPQTRMKIRERLRRWLSDEEAEQKMLWVRGFAGTGKSAVAQSFCDSCEEEENLGGSYFFSRAANRNKLETVVPTLLYQLAESIPEYRSFIEYQLARTPLLLRKSPPVQFRKLIVEPFATLQRQRHRKPIAIILDGLDECEGEDAQLEIIEMITNAVSSNPDLPLRWLIFSRPEAHLNNTFSTNTLCGREELVIDAECWEDVERYTKDRLAKIKNVYRDVVPRAWPSQDQLRDLLDAVAGLFVFASTCLNFIADPEGADPPSRLNSLLTFLRRSQGVVSRSPLAALDLLYSQILEKIPSTIFKTTRRILGYMCHRSKLDKSKKLRSTRLLSNFLRLDQPTFYKAVRGLHSVMPIPEPIFEAQFSLLQFYHASFQDFLLDPNRSGNFCMREQDVLLDALKSSIYWNEVDLTHFHTQGGWSFDDEHRHDDLPGLTWVSEHDLMSPSLKIIDFSLSTIILVNDSSYPFKFEIVNEELLSLLSDLNFRYCGHWNLFLLARICQMGPSTSVVRAEPSAPTDHKLLEYFNLVISNGISKPAKFPLTFSYLDAQWTREYFFVGHGVKSVIAWTTKSPSSIGRVFCLRCDQEPSQAQISEYGEFLQGIGWDEETAKLEMK